MSKTIHLIQRIEIASPCPVEWNSMTGDDRSRFCPQCRLNVYDFSAMTAEEGERLIIEKEGRLCVQIYRRRDGTVITSDCPVGLAAIRSRSVRLAVRVAAVRVFAVCVSMTVICGGARERNVQTLNAYQRTVQTLSRWLTDFRPAARGRIAGSISAIPGARALSTADATDSNP